ncbi:MAG: hypothetical protein JSU72_12250 [Deltaproteobacteria bacterium]|nr:MAG: hypothetical protein JSU72_12250 [Deltaproteobacteria bacterium]
MDILQHIKSDRARKRRKQAYHPSLFGRINGLVKMYDLDKTFLQKLDNSPDFSLQEQFESARVRVKSDYEPPPFSLATDEQYSLTKAIISRVDNPYIWYANSPDEIFLCGVLFAQNSSLGTNQLERYHFETLLMCEYAKQHVKQWEEEATDLRKQMSKMDKTGSLAEKESSLDSLEKRIQQLQSFIINIESSGSQPG